MSFSEKESLTDERRPLLRDPVWHCSHRYGRSRNYDPEEVDELIGLDIARNQRFQWIIFLGVTFVSIIILLATLGVLIKLSQTHPSVVPRDNSTTPPVDYNIFASVTTGKPSTLQTTTKTTTVLPATSAQPQPPLPDSSNPIP